MFNILLERLTELRKGILLIVKAYCSERIQVKISEESIGQGSGDIKA